MSEMNSKVEYKNLIGFPDYNDAEIHLLQSNDKPFGYNDIDLLSVKNELNINQNSIHYNNCILAKSKNLIYYDDGFKINIASESPFKYIDKNNQIHEITEEKTLDLIIEEHTDWIKKFIFFDYNSQSFIAKTSKFKISIEKPVMESDDFWLSILENKIYNQSLEEMTYFPIAEIDIDPNNMVYIFNYPCIANWYDRTIKSIWVSPLLLKANFPLPYSLPIKDKLFDIEIVCMQNDFGYKTGETVQLNFIPIICQSQGFIQLINKSISIINKDRGADEEITLGDKWKLLFKIW